MKIGAVIIARYNSSRLYGKVLRDLKGVPALQHTYNRLSSILPKAQIMVATSSEVTDDPISDFCKENDWTCFRGDLDNVAERFLLAGKFMNWDYIIRVNGDNIFIDTDCMKEMLSIAESGEFDFLSNVKNRTFPKGMSIEIVRTDFYSQFIEQISASDYYKEHVTIALYENGWGNQHFFYNTKVTELQGIQLALDTAEDFDRIEKLITILGSRYENYKLADIKTAYEQLER